MTDWLEKCRAAVEDAKVVFASMDTRAERARPVGQGKGGDTTIALDEAAETAVLKHFAGPGIKIVSEEIGIVGEGAITVVVDPIDGSQNAERGIPYYALSVAVADGDTIDDVFFGYVYDFGASEEWVATKGEGVLLNGKPLVDGPQTEIQFLSIEATRAAVIHEHLGRFVPLTDRIRVMGAQAITLCHMASGRTDALACLKASRTVDMAAAQLVVREQGYAILAVDGPEFGSIPLDLEARSRLVAAATPELCETLATALRG